MIEMKEAPEGMMPLKHSAPDGENNLYKIVLKEDLDPKWSEWFNGLVVQRDEGRTVLIGPIRDNAALHGLFHKIRDLNLTLLAVIRLVGNNKA